MVDIMVVSSDSHDKWECEWQRQGGRGSNKVLVDLVLYRYGGLDVIHSEVLLESSAKVEAQGSSSISVPRNNKVCNDSICLTNDEGISLMPVLSKLRSTKDSIGTVISGKLSSFEQPLISNADSRRKEQFIFVIFGEMTEIEFEKSKTIHRCEGNRFHVYLS
uniref:Uncharacterized protein n=1 Tax=Salix viminalis TaxID=40686 RepID=A0A6N2LVI2_SALVM